MFMLDVNVLPAMMSTQPMSQLAAWVAAQQMELLFTASACQAAILSVLAIMPQGRRRQALEARALSVFMEDFEGRVLPFDMAAAVAYAEVLAARQLADRPASYTRSDDRIGRTRPRRERRDA